MKYKIHKRMKIVLTFVLSLFIIGCASSINNDSAYTAPESSSKKSLDNHANKLKVAAFNVSMEARNYLDEEQAEEGQPITLSAHFLMDRLATDDHPQIKNIAEIIQRNQPDVILLNEFDYIDNPKLGIKRFIKNYLNVSQNGANAIDYPFIYIAPSNTGLPTNYDYDNDGVASQFGADAYGFGLYYGHYAMALLSKYPIDYANVRTFQRFLWSDMPGALAPINPETNEAWYDEREWLNFRLSSKSHWDVPILVNNQTVHILASHPTPPSFDGDEDRNGRRNHDEIRFWLDYITPEQAEYIYDDKGIFGGIAENAKFVIAGDLNASPDRTPETKPIIRDLLASPFINDSVIPSSQAGQNNRPENDYGAYHTATWGARADYVLPSQHFTIDEAGVFWPMQDDPLFYLVESRASSSDHRLVWVSLSW